MSSAGSAASARRRRKAICDRRFSSSRRASSALRSSRTRPAMWSANTGLSFWLNKSISAFSRRRFAFGPLAHLELAGRGPVYVAARCDQRFGDQGGHCGVDADRVERARQGLERARCLAEAPAGEGIGPELGPPELVKLAPAAPAAPGPPPPHPRAPLPPPHP